MSERWLYAFVDESGRASCGECYVVAATWCVSTRRETTQVLSATKDACLELIDGSPTELKGASLSPSNVDTIVSCVESFARGDETVADHCPAWTESTPLRHTLHATQPSVLQSIAESRLDAPERIKRHSLGAVLDPLFRPTRLELDSFAGVRIVLDAETWRRVKNQFETATDSRSENYSDRVSFAVADSTSVPGLQVSDLAAYSWRRNRCHGDCTTAAREVDTRRFGAL